MARPVELGLPNLDEPMPSRREHPRPNSLRSTGSPLLRHHSGIVPNESYPSSRTVPQAGCYDLVLQCHKWTRTTLTGKRLGKQASISLRTKRGGSNGCVWKLLTSRVWRRLDFDTLAKSGTWWDHHFDSAQS